MGKEPFELTVEHLACLEAFDRLLLSKDPEEVTRARADMDVGLARMGTRSRRFEGTSHKRWNVPA